MKKFWFQKKYNYGIKAQLKSHTCNFFLNQFFFIFKKKYKCWLIQSLQFFWHSLKKITTTGSSANFLSPKPNGQGCYQKTSTTEEVVLDWYSSMNKKFRNIPLIFHIENWVWKVEMFAEVKSLSQQMYFLVC